MIFWGFFRIFLNQQQLPQRLPQQPITTRHLSPSLSPRLSPHPAIAAARLPPRSRLALAPNAGGSRAGAGDTARRPRRRPSLSSRPPPARLGRYRPASLPRWHQPNGARMVWNYEMGMDNGDA